MTTKHPKMQQGRRCDRIKPVISIPEVPTHYHKRIDKILQKAQRREENLATEERNRQACAERQQAEIQRTHRHKYKKVLRETEEGNRVVACTCGAYTLVPKP